DFYLTILTSHNWKSSGRTEVIDNTLNPDFVRKFVLDYFFEEKQNLRFDVYNVDSRSSNISKHSFLGQTFCTLGEIIGSSGSRLERVGIPGKKCGSIIFTAEELSNCRVSTKLSSCTHTYHDFIGEFTTSYRELSRGQSQFNVYEVLNPKKKGRKKKYVNSGTVRGNGLPVKRSPLLIYFHNDFHYLSSLSLSLSLGNPSQPTSLHYMNPYQLNAYAMALKAVGEIIQDYDSDKLFPAYGFGAKLPPDGKISHAFPLNSDCENANCVGIEGVLEAYYDCLRKVQLYGPTNFAPVINQVAQCASEVTDGSQYFVLLVITDGVISDMVQTREAVVTAASLPMSIIIVGVGPAEFDAMEELDGDEVRVSSRGRVAERDIVQFVPFRDYIDRSGNQVLSMARLAKDVLAEIPDQLLSFMKSRGIEPRPALSPSPTPQINVHL
uniref:Copine family member 9 n=1 Tax=Sinocyclocheilus grahami TaxID=75366 RepID=A0A672MEC2_SINGR